MWILLLEYNLLCEYKHQMVFKQMLVAHKHIKFQRFPILIQ